MRIVFMLFLIAYGSLSALSRIEECASIEKLLEYAKPSQLIILDIDNTIYRPKQMLGSDEWFDYMYNQKKDLPYVLDLWSAIQTVTEVVPMEAKTTAVLQKLQQRHMTCMAMTTRGERLLFVTLRQFDALGIQLTTAPTSKMASYQHGVLFTDGKHKGKALNAFLATLEQQPKSILYINDKRAPLQEVMESLPPEIDYIGLRYTPADLCIKEFNPEVAKKELDHFMHVPSDQDSLKVI